MLNSIMCKWTRPFWVTDCWTLICFSLFFFGFPCFFFSCKEFLVFLRVLPFPGILIKGREEKNLYTLTPVASLRAKKNKVFFARTSLDPKARTSMTRGGLRQNFLQENFRLIFRSLSRQDKPHLQLLGHMFM